MKGKVAMAMVGGLAALVMAACNGQAGKPTNFVPHTPTVNYLDPMVSYLQRTLDNPVCSGEAKLDSPFRLYCVAPSDIVNARSTLPIMDSNTLPDGLEGGGWHIELRGMNYEHHSGSAAFLASVYSNTFPAGTFYGLDGMRPNEIFFQAHHKSNIGGLGKHPLALVISVYTGRDLPESTLELDTKRGKQKFYLPLMTAGTWELLPNQSGSTYLMARAGMSVSPEEASQFTKLAFTPLSELVQNVHLLRAAPQTKQFLIY